MFVHSIVCDVLIWDIHLNTHCILWFKGYFSNPEYDEWDSRRQCYSSGLRAIWVVPFLERYVRKVLCVEVLKFDWPYGIT